MRARDDGLDRLRGVARRLLWGALACLVLPALAWLGVMLYETVAPPTDGHLWGILAVALVLYVAPVGVVLLVLGLTASAWGWWLGRAGEPRAGDPPPARRDEGGDP